MTKKSKYEPVAKYYVLYCFLYEKLYYQVFYYQHSQINYPRESPKGSCASLEAPVMTLLYTPSAKYSTINVDSSLPIFSTETQAEIVEYL